MSRRRRKCRNCGAWFEPQPHNAYHQQYCTSPVCQAASKRRSHAKWRHKNPDAYKSDGGNGKRVQDWRAEHPGYWRAVRRREQSLRLSMCRMAARAARRPGIRVRFENLKSGALQDLWVAKTTARWTLGALLKWCVTRFDGCFVGATL